MAQDQIDPESRDYSLVFDERWKEAVRIVRSSGVDLSKIKIVAKEGS